MVDCQKQGYGRARPSQRIIWERDLARTERRPQRDYTAVSQGTRLPRLPDIQPVWKRRVQDLELHKVGMHRCALRVLDDLQAQ
jgi:hypothetical protein